MGRIFYLMGKSASGKDTLYKRLKKERPELQSLIVYTTRPMREGEKQGVEYYFISMQELKNFQKAGRVIEVRTYQTMTGSWSYATIDDGKLDEKVDYLAIGTLDSFEKIKNYFHEGTVIPLYLEIEDGQRLERALRREHLQKSPDYAELCRRYLADENDFSSEKLKKSGISRIYKNDDLEKCVNEIIKDHFSDFN